MESGWRRIAHLLPTLVGLGVFVAALEMLRVELHAVTWDELTTAILATPAWRLGLAVLLTGVDYLVLAGYDLLAFRYAGRTLAVRKIVGAATLAYAVAHTVGFAMLSGASVRYRFYSRWGVTAETLGRIVFSYSVTFWLGLLALGGLSLVLSPLPLSWLDLPPAATTFVGWLLLTLVAAALVATAIRRAPLRLFGLSWPMPTTAQALQQLAVSAVDWALAGTVLYVLLPPSDLSFFGLIGAYLIAVLAGMVSHVPGGLGVFEGLLVLLLAPHLDSRALVPALVVYRAIYYLLPFVVALVGLTVDEARQRRAHVARAGRWIGSLAEQLAPRLLAASSFVSGAVLLLSGATPASPGRLDLLDRILPLSVVELSHFLASVAGAGLLVLAQGLARRLDAAYYVSSALIVVGMAASLLKGFDYEEATLLLLVLVALHRARPAFDRRAALVDARFSGPWFAAVIGALAASYWLGIFAFKHVDFANQLWWQFELHGEASRFLRASVGAAMVVLLAGAASLLRPTPHEIDEPSEADLQTAAAIVAAQSSTTANLVYLRDKGLIFDERREAFLMYGVQGRTWVAMGDPIGPASAVPGLLRAFLERADDFGAVPVFYEIGPAHMHRYADLGLTFVKLGEEARVDLATVTTQGGRGSRNRQAVRKLERDGGTFRVVPPEGVPAILPQLRAVSDNWLRLKAGAEKGFSLGFFDDDYLRRFPVAVVERDGQVQAFCNIWTSGDRGELSLDLMRYSEAAPKGVMEALLVHTMLWGQAQGYRHFALGMAPLSGFEASPRASLWHRLGALIYEHGEAVYGFQGLRAFKDKFDPEWEPRYLAYPGGLGLPRILADTSALIAGGYRRILLKGSHDDPASAHALRLAHRAAERLAGALGLRRGRVAGDEPDSRLRTERA